MIRAPEAFVLAKEERVPGAEARVFAVPGMSGLKSGPISETRANLRSKSKISEARAKSPKQEQISEARAKTRVLVGLWRTAICGLSWFSGVGYMRC
jgi:hypothetical protein